MTNISKTRFVLAVQNLPRSVEFYSSELGLKTVWTDDGWHCLEREHFVVQLGECKDDISAFETRNHSYAGYIEVIDVKILFDEYSKKNVDIIATLTDQDYGQREFAIRTPDGHRFMFGQSI